jgi:hypothetical protein
MHTQAALVLFGFLMMVMQQVLSLCYLRNFLKMLSLFWLMPHVQELEQKAVKTARLSDKLEQAQQQIRSNWTELKPTFQLVGVLKWTEIHQLFMKQGLGRE